MADAEFLGELCVKRHRVCSFYSWLALDAVDQKSSNRSRPIHAGRFKTQRSFSTDFDILTERIDRGQPMMRR
jgi:hypothetical protein